MGCRKLTYYETSTEPLKVVTGKAFKSEKVVQGFISVDPLAHEFPSWSPYAAFADNPVYYIDPDGRKAVPADKDSKRNFQTALLRTFTAEEGKTSVGEMLVSQMNFINSIDPQTGFALEGTPVKFKDFKKAVKKSDFSQAQKDQALALFEVISNDNHNIIDVKDFMINDFLPEFFGKEATFKPEEAQEFNETRITSTVKVGSKPGHNGIFEVGSLTIQVTQESVGNDEENNVFFERLIKVDKEVTEKK